MIRFLDVAYPYVEEPTTKSNITTYSIIAISTAVVLVVLVGISVALKNRKRS